MKIGFTGTRYNITNYQKEKLLELLFLYHNEFKIEEFHHGDCIGADAYAHDVIKTIDKSIPVHIHPPNISAYRAWKHSIILHPEKPYLERDNHIVFSTEMLISLPKGSESKRSGTWYTIRQARKLQRSIILIYPTKLLHENL